MLTIVESIRRQIGYISNDKTRLRAFNATRRRVITKNQIRWATQHVDTAREAAELLRTSQRTFKRECDRHSLPTVDPDRFTYVRRINWNRMQISRKTQIIISLAKKKRVNHVISRVQNQVGVHIGTVRKNRVLLQETHE